MKNLISLITLSFLILSCSKDTETPVPTPAIKYTLTITAGNGGSVDKTGGQFEKGTSVTVTANPDTGYEFEKWSDNNKDNPRTIVVKSDLDLTANFVLEVSNQLFTTNTTELDFSLGNLSVEDKVTGLNGALNGTISVIKGDGIYFGF